MMWSSYLYTLAWAAITVGFIVVSSAAVGLVARLVARMRGATLRQQHDTFAGYAFASPWIVGFLIFVLLPVLASVYWSFTSYRLPNPPQWVGLQNYVRLLTEDRDFRAALVNTFYLVVFGLPAQMVVALMLALLLNQHTRGEGFFRMAFYLPVILGLNSAVLLAWVLMFNANTGFVNVSLRALGAKVPLVNWLVRAFIYVVELTNAFFIGLQNGNYTLLQKILAAGFPPPHRVPLWLQSPLWIKPSIILLLVWSCGSMMLIYLAALNGIPREFYEAAAVDGATKWQRFRHITLPLLSPATFYNLVVGMIAILQLFEQPYVLLRDSPTVARGGYTVVLYLWRATFRFNEVGYGAAISWILTVIILIMTLAQFKLQDRWVQYELR